MIYRCRPSRRLILLSMHYVAQPSVAIWGRGDTTSVSPALTIHSLTHHASLHVFSTSLLPFTWTASDLKMVIIIVFNVVSLSFKGLSSLKSCFKNNYIKIYPFLDRKWLQLINQNESSCTTNHKKGERENELLMCAKIKREGRVHSRKWENKRWNLHTKEFCMHHHHTPVWMIAAELYWSFQVFCTVIEMLEMRNLSSIRVHKTLMKHLEGCVIPQLERLMSAGNHEALQRLNFSEQSYFLKPNK